MTLNNKTRHRQGEIEMFKHPTCGSKHETASQARQCELEIKAQEDETRAEQAAENGYVRHLENAGYDEARAQEQHEADNGVVSFHEAYAGSRKIWLTDVADGRATMEEYIAARSDLSAQQKVAAQEAWNKQINSESVHRETRGEREVRQFNSGRKTPLTEDGMYRDPSTGRIWKVQFNRAGGDGRRLYAKALVVDVEPSEGVKAEIHFAYAPGAMREIRPEWRMDLEEAKKWGALYGTCVYGHPLTKESSIKRGMGDKCWEKYGGGR
jgi:hypothetical protein